MARLMDDCHSLSLSLSLSLSPPDWYTLLVCGMLITFKSQEKLHPL